MDIKMEVDKIFASVGDEVHYSITLFNEKSIPLKEIGLRDELSFGMKFIEGSIEVDGCPVEGDINRGISLGVLLEGENKKIDFKCSIVSLPEINPIINTADVSFMDIVGEARKEIPSTAVVTVVTDPNINEMAGTFELFVDKKVVGYQGVLSYTIRLTNQGNCKAQHIYIKNLEPIQTVIRAESLRGSHQGELDLQNRLIYIEELESGEQFTLTYDVVVSQEMMQYEIPHQVILEYDFVGPDRRKVYKKYLSQKVLSVVCIASFDQNTGGFIKTANTSLCTIGDEITYRIKLMNSGNVTATHVRLIDRIPKGIECIPQSLVVGGVAYSKAYSLEEGMRLPDIGNQETVEISYRCKVNTCDLSEMKLKSKAQILYDYVVEEEFVAGENYSNVLETNLGIGLIEEEAFELVADKAVATLNDEVRYTMRLHNKGNISVENIQIVLDKPIGTQLIGKGWEEKEGKAYFQYEEELKADETIDMSYPLLIVELEALGDMQIEGRLYYSYSIEDRVIEKNLYRRQEVPIGIVLAKIQNEDGGILQSVNETCIALEEVLFYKMILTNTGNIAAKDVRFQRVLTGDILIEKEEAIEVGDIGPNESKIITYDLDVRQLPPLGYIGSIAKIEYSYEVGYEIIKEFGESQELITKVEEAYVLEENGQINQVADKDRLRPGDIITYTLELTNRGNVPAEQIVLTLPEVACGKWIGERSIAVEKIDKEESYYFTYQLEVEDNPKGEWIVSCPQVDYVFYTSQGEVKQRSYEVSPIQTPIYRANLTTSIGEKRALADKEYATLGDEITCTLHLFNEGNRTAKGVCLRAKKIEGIIFEGIEGELLFELGNIQPRESIEVSYTVKIAAYQEELVLLSELSYSYDWGENGQEEDRVVREIIKTQPVCIKLAQLTVNKWIDRLNVLANERINYELICINEGNTEAVNILLEECFPLYMHMCEETISEEGEGRISLVDKNTISIARMKPQEQVKIRFQVEIEEGILEEDIIESVRLKYEVEIDPKMPLRPIYVLPIETQLHRVNPKVEVKLIAEEKIGLVGEILPYQIEITNKGNITAQDILVEVEMIEGIECIAYTLEDMRIPVLNIGETRKIDFKMHVISKGMSGESVFYPYITYHYTIEENLREKVEKSEIVTLRIEKVKVELNKKTDKDLITAGIGDTISYHIDIVNSGTLPITQLVFYDELSPNTYLIEGSLKLNDIGLNTPHIGYGVNLGGISIGQTLKIEYKVRVDGCYNKYIISKSYLEYVVRRGEYGHYIKGQTPVDTHQIKMLMPNVATLSYKNILTLPYQYLDIDKIVDFTVEVVMINQRREESGNLFIQGQLNYRLVYVSIDNTKESIEWGKLFVETIKALVEFSKEEMVLQAVIEQKYVGMINNRQIESKVEVGISES
ncbi:MAG: hypothetical protein RSD87_04425 [Cellulosilyticaceae bacterium]